MESYKEITSILNAPSPEDSKLIEKAYLYAQKKHDGQKRYSGEPYFVHLCATAKNLAELGMGAVTISAGLLHDVIEDTPTTPEELRKEFGDEITFLVEGVTKLGHVRYHGTNRYNESLRRLFVATSQDIRVVIIKLADRLHNMQTLSAVPKEKQYRIAAETLEIYTPIAYRLGIRLLSRQLENLSFPYVYPKEYKELSGIIKERQKHDQKILEKFNKSLKKTLAVEGVPLLFTDYRVKSLFSLYQKWIKKEKDIEKIYDLLALRVVVPTVGDCYKVLGIIHSTWTPLPGRIKDYIAFRKPNGYKSIHTTVLTGDGGVVEIQIKTEDMYRESEYGVTSHITYKSKSKKARQSAFSWVWNLLPKKQSAKLSTTEHDVTDIPRWIRELVEFQKQAEGEDVFNRIHADFFKEHIFVFTPKGDTIDLPVDSTPVDFAFAVHSDIGLHASGARVNGKFVALNTVLKNGDIVEVETKKSSKPTQKWLTFVKTTVASRQIKNFLQPKEH